MKKINKLLVGTCCLAAVTSMALGILAFAEEQPQEQENAVVQEVQENAAPAEPLPTREEYAAILSDFNQEHNCNLAVDWEGVYADVESGEHEDYSKNPFLDKPIPEMTAEEFQACLEKIYAWNNAAPAEPLPTREEYAEILSDFNQAHNCNLAVDWEGVYADVESGEHEDYSKNPFLDKPIPEMTAEEFQACLEKIYAWNVEHSAT